jgi:hypothetical protein
LNDPFGSHALVPAVHQTRLTSNGIGSRVLDAIAHQIRIPVGTRLCWPSQKKAVSRETADRVGLLPVF